MTGVRIDVVLKISLGAAAFTISLAAHNYRNKEYC